LFSISFSYFGHLANRPTCNDLSFPHLKQYFLYSLLGLAGLGVNPLACHTPAVPFWPLMILIWLVVMACFLLASNIYLLYTDT
jgi:hypothetical protein